MDEVIIIVLFLFTVLAIMLIRNVYKRRSKVLKETGQPFPKAWREILGQRVRFYTKLNVLDQMLFEKRIQRFLAAKNIQAVETEIDDSVRLMVASSAIIPTFAFPGYDYPDLRTILIYPNSFDEQFQTKRYDGHEEFIIGLVGNRSMQGTIILSKPDLLNAFDGLGHKGNVGVHEFVHLLDKEDGAIDGVPQLLIDHSFVAPWLREIKKETDKIRKGASDIDPYALTNNAEFLAVVSEYFFDNPEKFRRRHAALYTLLSTIFDRDQPDKTM